MPNALRDGGQFHAAREDDTREEWLHFRSQKGDHEIWYSPINNRRFMVDSFIKSRHWANYTLKQAGLPKAF